MANGKLKSQQALTRLGRSGMGFPYSVVRIVFSLYIVRQFVFRLLRRDGETLPDIQG
jgi:hypothetical protein